jgi:antirestriction protein ArdC
MNRTEIFNKVTERVIAALEMAIQDRKDGKAWEMPWTRGVATACGAPKSISGRSYRGANYVILSLMRAVYPSQIFGTYKAWQKVGAQVKKGERATPVMFWKFTKDEDTGKQFAWAKGYSVFAAEQVEGFDLEAHQARQLAKLPNVAERLEIAEKVLSAYSETQGMPVTHGGDRAFYAPSVDSVQMPPREAFKSTGAYYSTLSHELAHSTGHPKRLARDLSGRFGNEKYAAEELIAELSAAMTCAALNIETRTREDHGRYLASWLKVLQDDSRAIVTAASMAQKASDMVLGDHMAEEEDEEETTAIAA